MGREHVANGSTLLDVLADGASQPLGATLQGARLVARHLRPEHLAHASIADDARQRQRDPVATVVRTDWENGPLVAQHDFGYAACDHADSVLAGAYSID